MDKFCLVAIMLFAIQRDMVDYSIVDVINAIEHDIYNVSFGVYDKYFDNQQFVERVLPF